MERVSSLSQRVIQELSAESIPVIVLKGGHTAHAYFPRPWARPSSDLDLLVPADCARSADDALASAGFHCRERDEQESSWAPSTEPEAPRSLWLVHAEDPWSIDLHKFLDLSPSPEINSIRLDAEELFARTDAWSLDPRARVLRQPLLLLHLAAHASSGLHNLALLRMVEIVLVIRHDQANGRLSWNEFMRLAERTGALGAAYPALCLSEKLAPGTVPTEVLERCASAAPPRARNIVDRLTPASAQRVDRTSIGEHFMWTRGLGDWTRQLRSDLMPRNGVVSVYQARAFRLLRGQISR